VQNAKFTAEPAENTESPFREVLGFRATDTCQLTPQTFNVISALSVMSAVNKSPNGLKK
jgi:hypothetical protein